jgi:hypothetical protein
MTEKMMPSEDEEKMDETKKAAKAKKPAFLRDDKGEDEDVKIERPETKKSLDVVAEDDLLKSLSRIEETILKGETPEARKQALLQKSLQGDASADESAELAGLLKGETLEPTAADEVAKAVEPSTDGDLRKSLDVSGALSEMFSGVNGALSTVADRLDKSSSHQGEVNLVLAKGLHDTGSLVVRMAQLVKSLDAKLDMALSQPVSQRRSITQPGDVVHKAHAGGEAIEDQVQKGDVMDLLTEMMLKAQTDKDVEKADRLNLACAGVEHTGRVDSRTMAEVAAYRRSKMGVAAGR